MIRTFEELSLNAWPALQTVFYDGWILRFANGYTRRANSILPLYPGAIPPSEKFSACEDLYRQRGLPVIFKLADRSESAELNQMLLERGYQAEADTSLQLADIRGGVDEIAQEVHLTTTLTPAWEAAYQAMNGLSAEKQARHRQILALILPQTCFASLQADGQIIGCALGVLQNGYLGVYDVLIHPEQRKKGCGERIMRSLLAWGRQQGAHSAYLQVMLNNPPALRLYQRLGFREPYQYWYCVKALK